MSEVVSVLNRVRPVPQSGASFLDLVLVETGRLSEQYLSAVQRFVVFDLGLALLPVGGHAEASQLIAQMVSGEDSTGNLLSLVQCVVFIEMS